MQRIAETELRRQLEAIEAGHYGRLGPGRDGGAGAADRRTTYLQGAVVVMDARTGDVLAPVGGRDSRTRSSTARPRRGASRGARSNPSSTSPLAAGFPPTHALSDTPLHRVLEDGTVWSPQNYEGGYAGVVTLRDALSSPERRDDPSGRRVGLTRSSTSRGGSASPDRSARPVGRDRRAEVTLELTAAYAAFATPAGGGARLVLRVEDRTARHSSGPPGSRARSGDRVPDHELLSDVVIGDRPRSAVGFRGPAAGKTGTTNDATDTWFLG